MELRKCDSQNEANAGFFALKKERLKTNPHCTVICNALNVYKNEEAVQLLSCNDYYEQLQTFSSDKVKYGIFTKCTDVSYQQCQIEAKSGVRLKLHW